MTERAKRLAELLWAYEADEPHHDEPNPRYFDRTWAEIEAMLAGPPCGDCIQQPAPCPRCWAEHFVHKARWIEERMP